MSRLGFISRLEADDQGMAAKGVLRQRSGHRGGCFRSRLIPFVFKEVCSQGEISSACVCLAQLRVRFIAAINVPENFVTKKP